MSLHQWEIFSGTLKHACCSVLPAAPTGHDLHRQLGGWSSMKIHEVLSCWHHHSSLSGCQEQCLWGVFCLAELVRIGVLLLSLLDTISTSTVLHAWMMVFVSVIGSKVIQCAESPWQRRYCQCVEYSPSTACWRRGEVLHDWRTGQGTGSVAILWSVTRSACSHAGI